MIRILVFGDIYGMYGRGMLRRFLPKLRSKYTPDFIVGNSENLTHGRGATIKHTEELRALGFDAFTGGNHTFDRLAETVAYIDAPESIQVRPLNYHENRFHRIPGRGFLILEKDGKRLLLVNCMSSTFLRDDLDNPFLRVDALLWWLTGSPHDAVLIDFHRETTAELVCMAHFLDGRASLVYGTHTHIQTNDEDILPGGTGMITDIGMTGCLDSSIGEPFEIHLPRLLSGMSCFGDRSIEARGRGVLTALAVEIEGRRCTHIEKIRIVCEASELMG